MAQHSHETRVGLGQLCRGPLQPPGDGPILPHSALGPCPEGPPCWSSQEPAGQGCCGLPAAISLSAVPHVLGPGCPEGGLSSPVPCVLPPHPWPLPGGSWWESAPSTRGSPAPWLLPRRHPGGHRVAQPGGRCSRQRGSVLPARLQTPAGAEPPLPSAFQGLTEELGTHQRSPPP